jgi:hypothetical protein
LEWAKLEDTRTAAIAEDRGFDDEGKAILFCYITLHMLVGRSLGAQYVFSSLLVVYLSCTFTPCADLQLLQQSGSMVGRSQTTTTKVGAGTAAGRKGSAKNKKRGNLTHYLEDTAAPYLPLPAGQVNIKRLVNANIAEPSKQKITGTVHGGWMFAFAGAQLCTLLYVRNESEDMAVDDAAAVVHRKAYIILCDLLLAQR